MQVPKKIYLYNGGKTSSLDLENISLYIKDIFSSSDIRIRGELTVKEKEVQKVAKELSSSKVINVSSRDLRQNPLPAEIEYEKKRILDPNSTSFGIVYDGFKLSGIFLKLIPEFEWDLDSCHIVFTNQLFGTWDESNCRWHVRVSVYGFPSIISTTGIVEAPAKPREYYIKKQLGIDSESLKSELEGRFIEHNDKRLTEVIKGYVLQAIFYHMTGDPFCNNENCRLFNAHWQEEVIRAQLSSASEFCPEHKKVIQNIKQ
ncbi:DUF6775 family putative metallopeptidase [Elusimicrobiota bacterium]